MVRSSTSARDVAALAASRPAPRAAAARSARTSTSPPNSSRASSRSASATCRYRPPPAVTSDTPSTRQATEDPQAAAAGAQVAPGQVKQESHRGLAGGPGSSTSCRWPSCRRSTRSQRAAKSRSCVTSTSVVPSFAVQARTAVRAPTPPVWSSRLPVGSSASSRLRAVHQRAGDRHALLLAARELATAVVQAVAAGPRAASICGRARRVRRRRRPSAAAGPRCPARSGWAAGGSDWNTMPMRSRRRSASAVGVQRAEVGAVEARRARGRAAPGPTSSSSSEVLPEPEGPAMATRLAGGDAQVHVAQHGHPAGADGVVACTGRRPRSGQGEVVCMVLGRSVRAAASSHRAADSAWAAPQDLLHRPSLRQFVDQLVQPPDPLHQ